MVLSILSVILALFTGSPSPQNFYQSYPSAKRASADTKKDMLVFFSSKTCSNCEAAWSSFTQDMLSTQKYISTRMDIEDFDGGVCFDMYELKQVPAWVIVSFNSEIREKWNGGWKDAMGNPTLFDQSLKQQEIKTESGISNTTTSRPIVSSTPVEKTPVKAQTSSPITTINDQPKVNSTPPTEHDIPKTLSSGWVIQAGYFGSEANAQKLIGDLKSKGFSNFKIQSEVKDGSNFYRVVSDENLNESQANSEQEKMQSKGLKVSLRKI